MSRSPWQLGRLDSLLQAALLLRLSEQGQARDLSYDLVGKVDAAGVKIDAFSLGVLDTLIHAHLARADALPVLLYLLKLDERGPGADTVDAAERALASGGCAALKRYVELGRETAVRALGGAAPCPGGYAELMLDELTHR